MRAAAERGRRLHALFERLPALPPEQRAVAADRWLVQQGEGDAVVRAELVASAGRVLDDPHLQKLFGPDALAEAPITAVIDGGLVVSGTVDRLLIEPGRVVVADFKTGRMPPAGIDAVPTYHLRQMAAYAAALGVIFPDHAIEATLVYTSGPTAFALSPALLEAHKPGFAPVEQS